MNDLLQGDPPVRAAARQLLPREGLAAAPRLIPLLQSEDPAARKAAFDVLWAVANETGAPGREKERKEITDLFMPLIAPDQPEAVRVMGLRLLAVTTPPGYSVSPIAALLKEPGIREKARTTLERIGTPEARSALRRALGKNDPEFTCALLESLGRLKDRKSVRAIAGYLVDPATSVRLAAARAIAWTGNPKYLRTMLQVTDDLFHTSNLRLQAHAVKPLLRFAEALEKNEKTRDEAVKIYLRILEKEEGAYTSAALVALGRIGEEQCLPTLLDALDARDPRTRITAAETLKKIGGGAFSRRLIQEYPRLSESAKVRMLEILHARNDSAAKKFIQETIQRQ